MGFYVEVGWEMAAQDPKVYTPSIWSFEKGTSTIFFLWIDVSKFKFSNDFDQNWPNYGTFVSALSQNS
jgi:hypothetical protein